MHDDELRFISDINAKKENAWKRLYQNYYPALCNYASRIIQDEVIVEDIVQESLINLWDSSATFQNIRSLTGWLYQAVYTRSLNTIRDQARTNKLHQNLWESVKEELTEEMAINSAIEEEILHKFRTIITQLSPQQQEIMKMSMDGMKVKEIVSYFKDFYENFLLLIFHDLMVSSQSLFFFIFTQNFVTRFHSSGV